MSSFSAPNTKVLAERAFRSLQLAYGRRNVSSLRRHGEHDVWSMLVLDRFALYVDCSRGYTLHTARSLCAEGRAYVISADSLDALLKAASERFPGIL
jgi:hypothetical protein